MTEKGKGDDKKKKEDDQQMKDAAERIGGDLGGMIKKGGDPVANNAERRFTDPGILIVGEEVLYDGESETMGVNPLIWMPDLRPDEDEEESNEDDFEKDHKAATERVDAVGRLPIAKLDEAVRRLDSVTREDAWSPEARAAAAEARKHGPRKIEEVAQGHGWEKHQQGETHGRGEQAWASPSRHHHPLHPGHELHTYHGGQWHHEQPSDKTVEIRGRKFPAGKETVGGGIGHTSLNEHLTKFHGKG